jgi:hypothetical protein
MSMHFTLAFPVLIVTTLLACLLCGALAALFVRLRPRRRLASAIWYTLAVLALLLSTQLYSLFVRILVFRGTDESFCFGEPHANMLVGLLCPPATALAVAVLVSRRRPRRAASKGDASP